MTSVEICSLTVLIQYTDRIVGKQLTAIHEIVAVSVEITTIVRNEGVKDSTTIAQRNAFIGHISTSEVAAAQIGCNETVEPFELVFFQHDVDDARTSIGIVLRRRIGYNFNPLDGPSGQCIKQGFTIRTRQGTGFTVD